MAAGTNPPRPQQPLLRSGNPLLPHPHHPRCPAGDFCANCDGNAKYCRACYNWEGEGTGVYAKNGRCERW